MEELRSAGKLLGDVILYNGDGDFKLAKWLLYKDNPEDYFEGSEEEAGSDDEESGSEEEEQEDDEDEDKDEEGDGALFHAIPVSHPCTRPRTASMRSSIPVP